jgi:hypothetical protein
MSETVADPSYLVGEDARIRVFFFEEDGVTPMENVSGVSFRVQAPSSAVTEYTQAASQVLSDGVGVFFCDHAVAERGTHYVLARCTAPSRSVVQGRFRGVATRVPLS